MSAARALRASSSRVSTQKPIGGWTRSVVTIASVAGWRSRNAKLAYQQYRKAFAGPRWEALAASGARPQQCLSAPTSVKLHGLPFAQLPLVFECGGDIVVVDTGGFGSAKTWRESSRSRSSVNAIWP